MLNQEFIESIRLVGEEWAVIPNWDRYAVSNLGRVVSLGSPYLCGKRVCYRKPQLIKPREIKNTPRYLSVVLSDGKGLRKNFLVHRLVATAFIPNPNNYPLINHKDENAQNNTADNLEWCTQKYNCNYGTHNERMAKTISKTAYQRKKVVQLSLDGQFVKMYDSIALACQAVGASRGAISFCCYGINPTAKGYRWKFLADYEKIGNSSELSKRSE